MSKHLRYLSYVARHKWFVFVAGLRVGAPLWRLVIHDWSKFTPSEWTAYATFFYAPKPRPAILEHQIEFGAPSFEDCERITRERADAFDRAWLRHQHASPHHWQHWVLREDSGATKVLEMPEHFAREMVADWMGAGRAITGRWEAREWYEKNRAKILLHPRTAPFVLSLLGIDA